LPPLTLEERYKGVCAYSGTVEMSLALDDVKNSKKTWNENSQAKLKDLEEQLEQQVAENSKTQFVKNLTKEGKKKLDDAIAAEKKKLAEFKKKYAGEEIEGALARHAALKYLNLRFFGRTAEVQMAFNPYIMAGFPGIIVANDSKGGAAASKSIIGMIQQVKHTIVMSATAGDAVTSIALNNARFIDEPTEVDLDGMPMYSKSTDPEKAEINPDTLQYVHKGYTVENAISVNKKTELNDSAYDYDDVLADGEYKYVKDILSLSNKDIASGSINAIYLDSDYEPSRISKFYKEAFGHFEDHFMIGRFGDNRKFAYDTMHEAVVTLGKRNPMLMSDYEACMRFVSRDVCSADAFFQGILGLSVLVPNKDAPGNEFVCKKEGFKAADIKDRYYGVTTEAWEKSDKVKLLKSNTVLERDPTVPDSQLPASGAGGKMTGPGQFSSILETMPLTAFIQERRDAVELYLKEVEKRVQGVRFD
jgi:hypothetical protein